MALKHRLEPHLRLIQFIGVVVCVIPLLFPSQVPSAIVIGSLLGLVAVFLLGPALGVRAFFCTPLDLPLAFLLLLTPLNVLISVDRALTLPHVYKIVAGTAVFYAAFGLLREKRWFDLTGWGLALLGLVLGGLLLLGTDWRSSGFSQLPGDVRAYLPRWTPFW